MSRRFMFMGLTIVAVLAIAGVMTTNVQASSHREAPGIMNEPAADNTDVYFFVTPDNPNDATLVGCWWPMEEPAGAPNYFHFAEDMDYVFYIDNDGDALYDIAYIFRFRSETQRANTFLYATGEISDLNDPDWNYRQTYTVFRQREGEAVPTMLASNLLVPPVNIGPRTTPDYENLVDDAYYSIQNGTQVFAGQRDDPFFVDLGAIFDLLGFRAIPGNVGEGVDGVGGYNCEAIVLNVPIEQLTRDGSNPTDPGSPAAVLGMWSATLRRQGNVPNISSQAVEVSRLGMPLVNEVVIALGDKDKWNRSVPKDDAQFLGYVTDPELARDIELIYGIPAPPTPRCDLVAIFLTGIPGLNQPPNVVPSEMIRLNVAIKPDDQPNSRFGLLGGDLDGFPNGRRLDDDVVDIAERVMEGVVYPLLCDPNYEPHPLAGQFGDGIDRNDREFMDHFPYLATPWQGWEHDHHRVEPPHPPEKPALPPAGIGSRVMRPQVSMDDGILTGTARFELGRSFPNPVNARADIAYRIAEDASVTLRVFDVNGRVVKTLVDGAVSAGPHVAHWDATDQNGSPVAAGVYLYRLETPGERADRKITIVR